MSRYIQDEWSKGIAAAAVEIDAGRFDPARNILTDLVSRIEKHHRSNQVTKIVTLTCETCLGCGEVLHRCWFNCPDWGCGRYDTCRDCIRGKIYPGTKWKNMDQIAIGDVYVDRSDGCCFPIVKVGNKEYTLSNGSTVENMGRAYSILVVDKMAPFRSREK